MSEMVLYSDKGKRLGALPADSARLRSNSGIKKWLRSHNVSITSPEVFNSVAEQIRRVAKADETGPRAASWSIEGGSYTVRRIDEE